MNDLLGYIDLGVHHIADLAAMDHLLFLVALVAPYRFDDWRRLLLVASAFTLGHSITLALAVTGMVMLPTSLVEFLIPVTIVVAALANLARNRQLVSNGRSAILAGGFGLIHGAGFANFLRSMFEGGIALPLFGFNVGIELGQLLIVVIALLCMSAADRVMSLRYRSAAASLVTAAWALLVAIERVPW